MMLNVKIREMWINPAVATVLSLSLSRNLSSNMPSTNHGELPNIIASLAADEQELSSPTRDGLGPFSTHLVLHLDINECVLVGDDAGGDSRKDSLNKVLAKSAFVKIPEGKFKLGKSMEDDTDTIMPTHWWNDMPIDDNDDGTSPPPPLYTGWNWPKDCCPYYRTAFKKRAKRFVENDGKPYKALYEQMNDLLSFSPPPEANLPPVLSNLLPALFETIRTLTTTQTSSQQRVSIVFRTFGNDLPDIADAVSAFASGKHPNYPDFRNDTLVLTRELIFRGRWNHQNGLYELLEYDDPTKVVARGDAEIVKFLQEKPICGINDDYEHWAANQYEPWAGKPVWVPFDKNCHHVLFDDNIHNLADDSIASVRMQTHAGDKDFRTLSGREIQDMQGLHLIRVPTIEPILNPKWFVQQLDKAQHKFATTYATK